MCVRRACRISSHPSTSRCLSESPNKATRVFQFSQISPNAPHHTTPPPPPPPLLTRVDVTSRYPETFQVPMWNFSQNLPPRTHPDGSEKPPTGGHVFPFLSSNPPAPPHTHTSPTPPRLTFSGGKYLTAPAHRVPCAARPGAGDMYIDKAVLLRVAADVLR